MKIRKLLLLTLTSFFLISCSGGNAPSTTSSSSSQTTSESSSSSYPTTTSFPTSSSIPTSETTSSRTSTSEEPIIFDNDTIKGLIGNTIKKYSTIEQANYFGKNCLLSDSQTSCSHKELLAALRLGFEGTLPIDSGERHYLGYFGEVNLARDLNQLEEEDFDFIKSYGFMDINYDPDEIVDMRVTQKYITRIYRYFGNNLKDDFARATNYDFYFNDPNDQSWTYDSSHGDQTILKTSTIEENIDELYLKMQKDQYNPSLENIEKYYFGESVYDPFEDEYYLGLLDDISSCQNLDELISLERSLQEKNSINFAGIAYNSLAGISKFEDYTVPYAEFTLGLGGSVIVSNDQVFEGFYSWIPDGYGELLDKRTLLEESEISDVTTSVQKVVNKVHDTFKEYYYEYADNQDLTYMNFFYGNIDYADLGYTAQDIFGDTADSNVAVSYIDEIIFTLILIFEALDGEIEFNDFKNFAYLSQVIISDDFFSNSHIKNGRLDSYSFDYLTQFEIMGYYVNTEEYKGNLDFCINLYNDIKDEYKNTINNNTYLSLQGKRSLINKINAIDFSIMFSNKDYTFDPKKYFDYEYSSSLLEAYFANKHVIRQTLVDSAKYQHYSFDANLFFYDIFIGNAFYSSGLNSIIIPTGAVLFAGYDYSKKSAEELYGAIGEVLAHEISHSIDPGGIYFDKNGRFIQTTILPSTDLGVYNEAQEKLIDFYSIEIATGVDQIGKVVNDEATADNLGLQVLINILESKEDFDFEKFFIAFSHSFTSKYTRKSLAYYALNDEHPCGAERLNLLLKNCPKFQEVFDIKEDDGMYCAIEDMVKVL